MNTIGQKAFFIAEGASLISAYLVMLGAPTTDSGCKNALLPYCARS